MKETKFLFYLGQCILLSVKHVRYQTYILIFSSPEPKAQVSFSDQNFSVVRRRRRCRKLFTFSSSSPDPLSQFQPNLAQSILG